MPSREAKSIDELLNRLSYRLNNRLEFHPGKLGRQDRFVLFAMKPHRPDTDREMAALCTEPAESLAALEKLDALVQATDTSFLLIDEKVTRPFWAKWKDVPTCTKSPSRPVAPLYAQRLKDQRSAHGLKTGATFWGFRPAEGFQ